MGFGRAMHSRVMVDNIEYEFRGSGIMVSNGPFSHNAFPGTPEIVPMGMSHKSGEEMKQYLDHHSQPGTFHMGDKNCNSFTDCALQFLVGHGLTIDRIERTT